MKISEIVLEGLDRHTPSAKKVADKHGVSVDEINSQLKIGIKIEQEHTTNLKQAREIALDHLSERPYYYTKLKKAKL